MEILFKFFLVSMLIIQPYLVKSLKFEKKRREIFKFCYLEYTGNNSLPRTTDHFIGLIDKIEHHILLKSTASSAKSYTISELAAVLLSRFRIDGIKMKNHIIKVDEKLEKRQQIIFEMIPDIDAQLEKKLNSIIDKVFTTEDNCTMHFMLSHSYIFTYEKLKPKGLFRRALDAFIPLHSPGPHIKSTEELGTIYNAFGTTFGGSILAGIAASAKSHMQAPGKDEMSLTITLCGSTICEALTAASRILVDFEQSKYSYVFGPEGTWNSNKCTRNYILEIEPTTNTYAYINGAIDGFLLGKDVSEPENQYHHLATILKSYFGSKDIYSINSKACQRWANFDKIKTDVKKQTYLMGSYLNIKAQKKDDTNVPKKYIDQAINYFNSYVSEDIKSKMSPKDSDSCPKSNQDYICSTDSEVIMIMDSRASISTNPLVTQILSGIDTNGSTIGVYTNVIDQLADLNTLVPIGKSSKIESICAAENFVPNDINSYTLSGTINSVNKFFAAKNIGTMDFTYMPNQIAVIMRTSPDKDETEVVKALANLADYQPGVTVLVVGNFSFPEMSNTDKFHLTTESLADIHKRICHLPGQLQYQHCITSNKKKEKSMTYTGRISPNHIKYLTLHSKYFYASSKVTITFKLNNKYGADNGVLKVYQDRGADTVSPTSKNWIKLDKQKSESSFTFENPCADHDEGKCLGISFAITGVSCMKNDCCRDKDHCGMPDQIQYIITHEGLYCGSALKMSSPIALVVSILALLFANNYH